MFGTKNDHFLKLCHEGQLGPLASKLSALCAKREVENTPKCTRLTVSLPHDSARPCRPLGLVFTNIYKSHKILFSRADSSLVDKPGNTPVHGGLTGFGKVRRLTMIWNNNQRHSSFPVISPFKWLWTLGCPPKAKLISVTYPLKSSCILGSQIPKIRFLSRILTDCSVGY